MRNRGRTTGWTATHQGDTGSCVELPSPPSSSVDVIQASVKVMGQKVRVSSKIMNSVAAAERLNFNTASAEMAEPSFNMNMMCWRQILITDNLIIDNLVLKKS